MNDNTEPGVGVEPATEPPQPEESGFRPVAPVQAKQTLPLGDYYGNAILGGIAMAIGAYFVLMAMAGLGASESFFDSTPALLALVAGAAMGGLGFVGVVVNELLKEVRKLRLGFS